VVDGKPLKLFAFGWPKAGSVPHIEGDYIIFELPVRLVVSSPVTETLDGIASGALFSKEIRIGVNVVRCVRVEAKSYVVSSDKATITTLSPITCYSQMQRIDGRKYTVYFSPNENEFSNSIHGNLIRKHRALYPNRPVPEGDVKIRPIGTPKEHIAKFKADSMFPVKGWSGRFMLTGPRQLLQVGVDCGLGAKNSSGFGCVIISDKKNED
jgi:CRISPR-associated endoribonuclease Cas6